MPFLPRSLRAKLFSIGGAKFYKPSTCFIGYNVYFDDLHLVLITIGENIIITEGTKILTHFLYVNHDDFDHQYIKSVNIGSKVFIGINTIIVKPVKIGDGAIIGANSVVNTDIPLYTVWGGNPARFIKVRYIKFNNEKK